MSTMIAESNTIRTESTSVDDLSVFTADGRNLHYERGHDLHMQTKDVRGGGEVAGVVFVELGIDGYTTHRARLDLGLIFPSEEEPSLFSYRRSGDEVRALTDAIDTLTVLRDKLQQIEALDEEPTR